MNRQPPRRIIHADDLIITIQGVRYRLVPIVEKSLRDTVIISIVAAYFKTTLEAMKQKHANKEVSYAKHIAIYLIRKYTQMADKKIAAAFGMSNHTSSLHARARIMDLITVDSDARHDVKKIEEQIEQQ